MTEAPSEKRPAEHPVACLKCGYDLRAHKPDANCPECNTPVCNSLDFHQRMALSRNRGLREGLSGIAVASYAAVVVWLLATLLSGMGVARMWRSVSAATSLEQKLFVGIAFLLGISALVIAFGVWISALALTEPPPKRTSTRPDQIRHAARVLTLLAPIGLPALAVGILLASPASAAYLGVVPGVLLVLWVAGAPLLLVVYLDQVVQETTTAAIHMRFRRRLAAALIPPIFALGSVILAGSLPDHSTDLPLMAAVPLFGCSAITSYRLARLLRTVVPIKRAFSPRRA